MSKLRTITVWSRVGGNSRKMAEDGRPSADHQQTENANVVDVNEACWQSVNNAANRDAAVRCSRLPSKQMKKKTERKSQ